MTKGYTTIPDWMLSLDLDVYETITLAVIYGFSQDGESTFNGSQSYLAKKAKCSRAKIARVLPKLVEMHLVEKIDKNVSGVHLCEYRVYPVEKGCVSQIQGCVSQIHNNIDKDIDIYNTLSIKKSRFVKPSLDEIKEYCRERNNQVDPEKFFNFYEAKGWVIGKSPMKSWKAAIHTWEGREEKRPTRVATRKESAFEHNLRVADELYGTNYHEKVYGKGGDR